MISELPRDVRQGRDNDDSLDAGGGSQRGQQVIVVADHDGEIVPSEVVVPAHDDYRLRAKDGEHFLGGGVDLEEVKAGSPMVMIVRPPVAQMPAPDAALRNDGVAEIQDATRNTGGEFLMQLLPKSPDQTRDDEGLENHEREQAMASCEHHGR